MILFYQIIIILVFIALGYFVFTKYLIKSKFDIINLELEEKKAILTQLVETNKEYQEMLDTLEKKSKLSQKEILNIYEELRVKRNENENLDVNARINRMLNS